MTGGLDVMSQFFAINLWNTFNCLTILNNQIEPPPPPQKNQIKSNLRNYNVKY